MKTQTCPHFWRARCLLDPCGCNPPEQPPAPVDFDPSNYAISEREPTRPPGPRHPAATGLE